MIAASPHPEEAERLADLRALKILDTPAEERFDRIVRLAKRIFDVPIAYIALVDEDRQWFKSQCGLSVDETERDISFCSHTILQKKPLIIPDATLDHRFWDNPMVVGEPYLRFYAGYPLRGAGGHNVGTLCLVDRRPRNLGSHEMELFRELAHLTENELRMVDVIQSQHELLETKNQLIETQRKLADDLADAAEYVRSLLPPKLSGRVRTDWQFIASSQLGGDLFGYHWLDDRHISIYLFDVCGHGVGAALLSIAIHTALRSGTLPETRFHEPDQVLAGLNRAFPMEENNNKFFTMWYGVYDVTSGTLCYANAGHPPAVLLGTNGDPPDRLGASSLMIGVSPDARYKTEERRITPKSRLYVFSDGVFEVSPHGNKNGMLQYEGFLRLLTQPSRNGSSRIKQVLEDIQTYQGASHFGDDFSLLEIEFN